MILIKKKNRANGELLKSLKIDRLNENTDLLRNNK